MSFENPLSIVAACIFLLCPSLSFGNFDPTEKCVPKTCPAGKKYHCLVDENWRQGETCLDNLMVTAGMCPYYNTYRGNLDVRPCVVEADFNACPKTNYQSYNGDQYSGCMMDYSNMDAASVITTSDYTTMSGTTTSPMTTSPQTPTTEISHTSKTAKSEANKADNEMELPSATPQIIAIIVVCIIIVLALIVIFLLYRKYPRFRRFVKGEDHRAQPALLDDENAAGQDEATSTERTAMLQEIPGRDIQSQHGTVSVTREESSSDADNLLHTGNADTEKYHLAPEYVSPNPRDSQSYSEDHRNDTERIPSHSIEHPKTISGCQTIEKNHDDEHNDNDSEQYKSCNDVSDPVDEKQDEYPNDEVQNEDDITQEPKGLDNEHLRANDSSKSIEPKPEETDSEPKPEETDSEPKPEEIDSEPKPEEIDSMTSKDSNGSSSHNKNSEGDKIDSKIKPSVNVSSSHEDKDKAQITSSSTHSNTEEISNTSSSSAVDDQHETSSTQSSAGVNSKSSSRSSNSSVENSYDVQNSTNDNNITDSNDIDNRKGEIALVKSHSDEDGIRKENENEASEENFAKLMKFEGNVNQHTEYDLPEGVPSDAVSVDGKRAKFEEDENRVNEAEKEADMSDKQSTVLENGNDSLRKETDNSKTINAIGVYALNNEASTKNEFQKDSMSPIESKDADKDSPIKNEVDNETRD